MNCSLKIFIFTISLLCFSNLTLNCEPDPYYEENPYKIDEPFSRKDFEALLKGSKKMQYSNLLAASCNKRKFPEEVDLSYSALHGASFRESSLKKVKLIEVGAWLTSFRWADLEDADLSRGDFTNAHFFGANLNGIIATEANFKNATGLTNEIKAILREQEAKNVPEDLTEEEFEKERMRVHRLSSSRIGEILEYIMYPFFYPVIKGCEIFLKCTAIPVINGVDKLADYISYCFKKKVEQEKERIE